jgi:hypothetical protein
MATDFPDIAFGTADETLYTSRLSVLGELIGGNAYSSFSTLALHGVYSNAQMTVTLTP